jgi:hypothetical protein
VGGIFSLQPAGDVVRSIVTQAQEVLATLSHL